VELRESRLALEGGRTLRLLEAGEGPPVVLVHGALATADDMVLSPLFPLLAQRFRVLAVDRPGHGLSRRERFEGAPARQAELIRAGLAQLGVERPLVLGHSAGGLIALSWAAAWPDALAGLVLVGPIVRPEFRWLEHTLLAPRATPVAGPWASEVAQRTVDSSLLPVIQRAMFAPQPIPERWKREFPHQLVLESLVANGEDAAGLLSPAGVIDLRRVSVPVAMLYGGEDRVVDPRRHAIPASAALPHATTQRLPGLGHMAHHFASEEIAAAVERLASTTRVTERAELSF
jgi:pimeloyl-ACP methyl ester carboxylesterase